MTNEELEKLLNEKKWTDGMRVQLVEAWNEMRTDVPKIGKLDVRTPCRLRQVISSFRNFLDKEKSVYS